MLFYEVIDSQSSQWCPFSRPTEATEALFQEPTMALVGGIFQRTSNISALS